MYCPSYVTHFVGYNVLTTKRFNMKKVLTLTALSAVLLSSTAMASGFHLREQSAAAQGNAFAGATAGAENISYTYFNVAGLTRHKGTQMNLGMSYIAPEAAAKNVHVVNNDGSLGARGSDIHNIVHAAVSPNITVSHQINDKSFIGLAINTPYGMITKYDQEWAGSDHGITSDLKSATITPMFAYKATDKLSLGVGMQIQYVWAHLTNSSMGKQIPVVTSEGNALDFGYQLGALYEFNENTRLGVGYRSQVRHKLKGDMKATMNIPLLNQDISAKLDTPAMFSVGAHHDINDKWSVMAEYQRVFWSSFKNLTFVGDSMNYTGKPYISQVKENWRDTNFWSLGTSYQMDNQWKLRLGVAYDQSAVRFKDRTPRIPDSDRIWYSVGLGYQYNDKLSFDAGYTYIKAHKAKMNTFVTENAANSVNASADYTNSVQIFALSVNYNF